VYTDRARSLYGTTQTHTVGSETILPNPEGLYPLLTPDWPLAIPGTLEEAAPWQWWDPASPLANYDLDGPGPGTLTAGQAAQASNPNFSGAKGRAYIDTIMGYGTPRIVCALQLGPCSLVGIDETSPAAIGVAISPNPSHGPITVESTNTDVWAYDLYDANGRMVRSLRVNSRSFKIERENLKDGLYYLQLHLPEGGLTRRIVLQ
jgi:hypothetical protein